MIPLISEEASSGTTRTLLREDREIVVWWGTWAECAVAISRRVREDVFDEDDETTARAALSLRLSVAIPSRDYPLKAADALQLAAALRWCEGDTENQAFVCLDNQLRRAEKQEGFDVLPEAVEEF